MPEFDYSKWREVPAETVKKGLLPNSSTQSTELLRSYDKDVLNIIPDVNVLAPSLLGNRSRPYFDNVNLNPLTQFGVFQNLIEKKGTIQAAELFKKARLSQGEIDYDVYENWAIKSGEYGSGTTNFIDLRLDSTLLTANPNIVSVIDGEPDTEANQNINLSQIIDYTTKPLDLKILPLGSSSNKLPSAGYVNIDDVKLTSFYYSGLGVGVNSKNIIVPIEEVFVGDYLWMADFMGSWGVYSLSPVTSVLKVSPVAGEASSILTFSEKHSFKKFDPIAIINFSDDVTSPKKLNLLK